MKMRPEGFKDSDIGPIPQDWEVGMLGEVCHFVSGSVFPEKYQGVPQGKYPFAKVSDMSLPGNERSLHSANNYIDDGIAAKLKVSLVPPKSTVFAKVGAALLLNRRRLSVVTMCIDNNMAAACPNRDTWYEYLFYLLQSIDLSKYCQEGALPSINTSTLQIIPVPSATLEEQQAIAGALSDIDALISAQEELLAKKRAIKQGAMQELLTGRRRLPGFPVRPMKQTDIGPIPEDWEVKQLGKLTSISAGGTPSTNYPEYWNGSIPWMSSGELHAKYISEVKGRITQCGLDNSAAQMLPCGCVLIGLAGQGKTRGTVAYNEIPLCTNQSIAAIFPDSHFISLFVYHYLDNQYYELRALSSGDGGRGGLNIKILGTVSVPFPSLAEQESIAMILSNMDAEITAVEEELAKQRALKRGMMQELLCGRIRLPYNKPTHRKQHA